MDTGQPIPARWTLPARAYVSEAVFDAELEHAFGRAWVLVCHSSDVAVPGAYVAAQIAREPVVVLRDQVGQLRAMSAVCRHRAGRLFTGHGTCGKLIQCPYHGWSYHSDGRLAAMAEAKGMPEVDPARFTLPAFKVAELAGLVFVNLDANAPSIAGYFGDLEGRLEALGIGRLTLVSSSEVEYDQNWKVIADNFLEGYHIPIGHPGLMRLLESRRYTSSPGLRHTWYDVPLRDRSSKDLLERAYQRLVRVSPGLPPSLHGRWQYAHLWPSTFLDIYPDQIETWQLIPVGVRRTRAVSRGYAPSRGSLRDRLARWVNDRINDIVSDEDEVLCRGVQGGLESRSYQRGLLHTRECGVLNFHDMLRECVPGIDIDADEPVGAARPGSADGNAAPSA